MLEQNLVWKVRAHHKISEQELANLLGCSRQMVHAMEYEIDKISNKMHEKLINILEMEPINQDRTPVWWR
jgi:predicted transcriptional regulator